jgi:prevent-host-death family protein
MVMSKRIVTVHVAKTQLSRLIAAVEAGEEIVIARRDRPVARLLPIRKARVGRRFGAMKGQAQVDDAFFAPLDARDLERWGS